MTKGSQTPGKGGNVGRVTKTQLREIAATEDEGHERQRRGGGGPHAGGLRPFHGSHRGGGVSHGQAGQAPQGEYAALDRDALLPLAQAIRLVKANAKAKFDETVEIAMNLGIDPRHADQMVRGVVGLPNGTGKTVRVGVFARGAKAEEALAAGADVVGAEDLADASRTARSIRPLHRHAGHDGAGRPAG